MNLAQISKQTWRRLAGGLAVLAGGCAGWLAWILSGGQWSAACAAGVLGIITVGPLVVLTGSLNLKMNDLRGEIQRRYISLREMTNIRPLLDGPPLDYGNWAVDPHLGKVLAQLICRHEPDYILECGSGTSTVFMARVQHRFHPDGTVTALEHLPEYAEESRRLLEDHGLGEQANVILAPLEEWNIQGKQQPWYGVNRDRFTEQSIDMMVVDGPPETTGPMARFPAAVALKPYLSKKCVIVLDDGDRSDEKKTAQQWAEMLDADLEYAGGPKGTYILRRSGSSGQSS